MPEVRIVVAHSLREGDDIAISFREPMLPPVTWLWLGLILKAMCVWRR